VPNQLALLPEEEMNVLAGGPKVLPLRHRNDQESRGGRRRSDRNDGKGGRSK
jgi:hypothetical protein